MPDRHSPASPVISSDRVNGTAVFGADRAQIGTIDHLVIDKVSGKIAYAVMGFGGFLGLGEDHYPVPWNKLVYDTHLEGFVTDITEEQVKGAPDRSENWRTDRDWERRAHEHYGAPLYWM